MSHTHEHAPRPWYKEPWPWLLMAVPVGTVIGSVITIMVASNNPDNLVVDDYYKEGLAINQNLDRLERAQTLGIEAELQLEGTTLTAKVKQPEQRPLVASFFHPTLKSEDVKVRLLPAANGLYRAEIPQLAPIQWQIHLGDTADEWRLQGSWQIGASKRLLLE